MDIEQYISSGILELYVAGALEKEAMAEVAQHIQQYTQIRDEVNMIEQTLMFLFKISSTKVVEAIQPQLKSDVIDFIKN